ncbi:MAG: glycosyltransferase family 4 protein [Acidimicrobiia bacterium]
MRDTPAQNARPADKLGDVAANAGIRAVHILAWRDLDDPEAGGSEIHAHQIARRWAEAGIDVTMRTSYAPNRPGLGVRDGYRTIRKAGRYLVFPRAIASELTGRMGPKDAIVEVWNGVPFLTPVWWHGPRMVWLHHVHGEMWHQIFSPGLASFGEALESRWTPKLYRRTPIVTLSPSSRDLISKRLGLDPKRVEVVAPGIDRRYSPGGLRSARPLVIAVGRLVPVKRLGALIDLMADVRARVPDVELVIVGDGYERPALEEAIRRHDAEQWIWMPGRVSDAELVELYRRAWAVTSVSGHEGWGMTMTEAAACGTPAVASDIAGHRDAVADGVSGLLASGDNAVADALVRILTDHRLRERLSAGALQRAAELSWDTTARRTFDVLAADALRRGGSHR